MSINYKSVLTSGLVAGLIINISAMTMVPVVGNSFDKVLADRGLPPLSPAAMSFFVAYSFIMGFALVWLFAALKPHFGTRMKTMMVGTLFLWFIGYFLGNIAKVMYGFIPIGITMIGIVWGLGELLLAGVVGARLYKEKK